MLVRNFVIGNVSFKLPSSPFDHVADFEVLKQVLLLSCDFDTFVFGAVISEQGSFYIRRAGIAHWVFFDRIKHRINGLAIIAMRFRKQRSAFSVTVILDAQCWRQISRSSCCFLS